MFTITKRFSFAAAHHLTCVPEGHKCRRPHGHTYHVEVELSAEELTNNMVRDYGDLAAFANWLEDNFDHRDLNTVLTCPAFTLEPTAENLALFIYTAAVTMFPEVTGVVVEESPTTSAMYRP